MRSKHLLAGASRASREGALVRLGSGVSFGDSPPMLAPINSMGTSWQTVESLLLDQIGVLPPRPLNIDSE